MSHFVYIIFSDSRDKYYIGESANPEQRLAEHNTHLFKRASTRVASDWKLKLIFPCSNRVVARKIEKHIKSMKSAKYVRNLIQYPDMVRKLKSKYEKS